jgi:protein-S-isoprenylcysteine O-methyltransferase Ste14
MTETLRLACLVILGLFALAVADVAFRTLGQTYVVNRLRQRLVLFGVEIDLVVFWALAVFWLRWDPRLVPLVHEEALAPAGTVLVALGFALALWGKVRLGRWFSGTFGIKVGHELVTDGPYAVTRHPIYTGMLAMLAGAALAWNSLATLGLAVLMVPLAYLHTRYEEPLLEAYFGEAYREYRRRVPRLLPWPRPRD